MALPVDAMLQRSLRIQLYYLRSSQLVQRAVQPSKNGAS
jgi:hypothetical protein